MQKCITVICTALIFFLCSCHTSGKKQIDPYKNTEETQSLIPVTDFLLGQLKVTDSLPVTPLKITITGNRQDSVWLKKEDIRKFAVPFLHPVIDSIFMRDY